MKHLKTIFACLLMAVLSIGQVWGASVTFTPNSDDTSTAKDGISISMSNTTGTSGYYQAFKSSNMVVNSTSANIVGITFTCTASGTTKYGPGCFTCETNTYSYSGTGGSWSGNATNSVSFYASTNQVRMSTISVAYKAKVTFNTNGGDALTPSYATQDNATASITLPTPTRNGFNCTGWYTTASGEGTKRGDAGGSYTPTSSETLYARWEAAGGCSTEVNVHKGAETNGTYSLSAESVCADGDGGTVNITDVSGIGCYEFDEIVATNGTPDNTNMRVTGITAETTITVKFKKKTVNTYIDEIQDNGSQELCSTTAPTLTDKTAATTGSCAEQHWHFVGWVSEANKTTPTAQNIVAGGSTVTVNGTNYYAVWAKGTTSSSATVTFKTNNSDGTTDISSDYSDQVSSASGISAYSGSKIYSGSYGLKIGTGSAVGVVTCTLDPAITTKTITVDAKKYGTNSANIIVKVNGSTNFGSAQAIPSSGDILTFSLAANADPITINSVTVSTSAKQGYLKTITVGEAASYSDYKTICTAAGTVETPTFTVDAGTYNEAKSVELECETDGATIYYTIDGSDPDDSKTEYTGAISVDKTMTIKAIAIKEGLTNSEVASATYTLKCATPTITKDAEHFLNSVNVTLACTDGAATIHYTLDGSDPTGESATYSTPFSIDATKTVKAIAVKDNWSNSEVASETFTKANVLTVAQALTAIDALADNAYSDFVYVHGVITGTPSIDWNSSYKNATYDIKDAEGNDVVTVFRGKFTNNTDFDQAGLIQVGDEVTVYGKLQKYVKNSTTTPEVASGNYIVIFYPKARLSWSAASYTAALGSSNNFPTLTNTNGVAVTYSSSDDAVATFTDNTDYATLQLTAAGGPVNITASFAGNETYKANSVSYALTVEGAVERGTITFNVDGGDAIAAIPDATELPNPLPIPTKAGKNFVNWYTDSEKTIAAVAGAAVTEDITLYATWRDPYTVTEALAIIATYGNNAGGANDVYVAGKVSTAPSSNPSSGKLTYSISVDGTASDEIKVYLGKNIGNTNFTAKTDVQQNDQVVVYGKLYKYYSSSVTPEVNTPNYLYSLTRKAEAELSWNASSAVVGITGDKNYPSIVNPHSVDGIKYSSSDPTVASFADENTYAITLHKAGTVTITATFDGDEEYKNDEASYTLEVRDVLAYVTITYNCDGATTGCPDPNVVENQTNLPSPLPTVTKDGFNFGGWFTNAGKTDAAVAGAALTGDVTLYAKWIEIPTFNNTGYEWQLVTSDAQLVANNYYVIASDSKGKVASRTLNGGYLSEESAAFADGVIAYNGFGSSKVASQSNVAVFQLGGNSTDGWTLTEVLGSETGLLGGAGSNNLAWGGNYTTWPITIDESSNAIIGTSDGYRVLHNAGTSGLRFKTYSSATSTSMLLPQLYVWTEKTFKLRYDANEGSNAPTATSAVAGKAIVTSSVPTAPTGKIFNGWNENAGGTGASYVAGDEVAVSGADVTIFAQWRDPVDYTVSYNANGGTLMEGKSDIDPVDVTEGTLATVAANVYEKEGFVFGGWKLGDDIYMAGQKFTMPAENVELVAQWASLNVTEFVLVTDVKQLKDGDKVYIVAAESGNAMSAQNGNYRNRVEIQKSADNSHVVLISAEPVEFTLGKDNEGKFTFYDGTGYLYASSGSSNNIGTETNLDANDNGKWEITISDGVASVIAQGTNSRKDLRYNATSGQERFSCYATTNTTMKPVAIYKRPDYSRDVTAGRFGTICLPKAGRIEGADLFEVAYYGATSQKIFFDQILNGEMEAGIPYIFLPLEGASKLGVYYADNTVADAAVGNNNGLYGSYSEQVLTKNAGNYILYNNQYLYVGDGSNNVKVGANRAYIRVDDITHVEPSLAPGRRRVSMDVVGAPQVTTGVGELNADETPVKVMIDGQLYIIRGEKMYDATGRLVK